WPRRQCRWPPAARQARAARRQSDSGFPSSSSQFHDRLEAAKEHALAVEWHVLGTQVRQARIGHDFLVDPVALRARLVDDPGKDHHLAGLELDALRERGVLARLDVVGHALDV